MFSESLNDHDSEIMDGGSLDRGDALKRAGKGGGYVLGVNSTHPFRFWGTAPPLAGTAEQIAEGLDKAAWQRLSAGGGAKGARLHDWAEPA